MRHVIREADRDCSSALILLLTGHPSTSIQTLISPGSLWKYNDSGVARSGWTTVAFSDAAWASGVAQLGYGDGDESTTLSYGGNVNNRRIAYYFRRAFTVSNPASFTALAVR